MMQQPEECHEAVVLRYLGDASVVPDEVFDLPSENQCPWEDHDDVTDEEEVEWRGSDEGAIEMWPDMPAVPQNVTIISSVGMKDSPEGPWVVSQLPRVDSVVSIHSSTATSDAGYQEWVHMNPEQEQVEQLCTCTEGDFSEPKEKDDGAEDSWDECASSGVVEIESIDTESSSEDESWVVHDMDADVPMECLPVD